MGLPGFLHFHSNHESLWLVLTPVGDDAMSGSSKISSLFLLLHKTCSHMIVKGVQQVKSLYNDLIKGPELDIDEILLETSPLF